MSRNEKGGSEGCVVFRVSAKFGGIFGVAANIVRGDMSVHMELSEGQCCLRGFHVSMASVQGPWRRVLALCSFGQWRSLPGRLSDDRQSSDAFPKSRGKRGSSVEVPG